MADNIISYKIQADGTAIRDLVREAGQLKKELENASDPKEINRLNKSLDATNSQIKEINKSVDQFNLGAKFEDVYGDVQPLTSRLGELEDRMYELALAGNANSEEFKALQKEASNMRRTIIDVDKQVDLLAENKGMSVFAAGFGEVTDSFMRLDFESAALQADNLAKASSKVSFGSAIKSLKNLGKTFASLGKALLTNPFFLMVAVVGAIIAIIVKLMDEVGLLKVVMDALGKVFDALMIPINALIDGLKALTDWLGWTSNAEDEAAEKSRQAAEKRRVANEIASKRIEDGLSNEIEMMRITGASIEDIEDKEIQLAATRIENFKAKIKQDLLLYENLRNLGLITNDQIKEEAALYDELKALENDLEKTKTTIAENRKDRREADKQNAIESAKEIAEIRKEIDRKIQEGNIEMIEDEIERERQLNVFREEMAWEDLDRTNLTNEQIEALERQHLNRIERINIEAQERKDEREQKRKEKEKKEQDALSDEIEAEENEKMDRQEMQFQRLLELQNTAQENELLAIRQKYVQEREMAEGNAELMKAINEKEKEEIDAVNESYAEKERQRRESVADFALSSASGLFNELGKVAEEGSAASKVLALGSIIADSASALMKAVPVALEASKATGPAAPVVFAGTLAGIVGTIVGAAANAKNVLKSAPGKGGGASGGAISAPPSPTIGTPQGTPDVVFGNDNEDINQNATSTNEEKVYVVDYTDIDNKGKEVKSLQNRVELV